MGSTHLEMKKKAKERTKSKDDPIERELRRKLSLLNSSSSILSNNNPPPSPPEPADDSYVVSFSNL